MNSKQRRYWQIREENKLNKYNRQEDRYINEIAHIYDESMLNIQREIDAFYVRYAISEHITVAEAKKRVSQLDITEYGIKARQYVKTRDFSDLANEEMKIYNLTMKVNRLENLKAKIGLELLKANHDITSLVKEKLLKRTIDETRSQAGILGKAVPDIERAAESIVESSVFNAKFNDTLWTHQEELKNLLHQQLITGMIQGKNPKALAREIKKAFGVATWKAERLMRTEMARCQIQAAQIAFDENDVEKVEFIANHKDGKTCRICKDRDGKVIKVKDIDKEIGNKAPPVHPNCRCALAPYVDMDAFEGWLDKEIALRKKIGLW